MYVKLHGGRQSPGGYIVPCVVQHPVMDERGGMTGAYVRLSSEDGLVSWIQYVKVEQLMNDDEAERDEV